MYHPEGDQQSQQQVGNRRGQSETIGFILVFSIMLLGASFVVFLGSGAISGTSQQLSDDRAENTMLQLDSKAGLVALGQADTQSVSLSSDNNEQFSVNEGEGWMEVRAINRSAERSDPDRTFIIMNETLGTVSYDTGDYSLAYQGGGVFRDTEGGGVMVGPPEFHYRDATLTLPAVNITGEGTLGDSAVIRQAGETEVFPRDNLGENPLANHQIEVTVQSDYYQGWGHYFEERTDGTVSYDHDAETVTIALVSPIDADSVEAATASLSAAGEFQVNGQSGSRCSAADDIYTDSYNSTGTSKDYCQQFNDGDSGNSGDVVYGEDIDISEGSGGSDFRGDIISGGTVDASDGGGGQPDVYGNINYTDSCVDCSAVINGGEITRINGVETASAVDFHINNTLFGLRSNTVNDPFSTETTDDELEAGHYYFESISMASSETVEFNATDGDVVIGVNESVELDDGAQIQVTGDNVVKLYIGGNGVTGSDEHFSMGSDAEVSAVGDNATQFRTYGMSDFNATVGGGTGGNLAQYTGVLYAPPGATGNSRVFLDSGEVYGGILAGTTTIASGNGGSIHYDEALEGRQIISQDANLIRVTYLHVTLNQIEISST